MFLFIIYGENGEVGRTECIKHLLMSTKDIFIWLEYDLYRVQVLMRFHLSTNIVSGRKISSLSTKGISKYLPEIFVWPEKIEDTNTKCARLLYI